MIGSLRGRLIDRSAAGDVIVEPVGSGVGYRVTPCAGALATAEVGSDVFVWIHHHIREDAQTLYAFTDRTSLDTFVTLIGTHGVGPAMALAILAVHRPADLARIVLEEDVAALCLVPGVGKKTAARLLIELQSRLELPDLVATADRPGAETAPASSNGSGGVLADVRAALASLGYDGTEIAQVTRSLEPTEETDVSDLLRQALRQLAER